MGFTEGMCGPRKEGYMWRNSFEDLRQGVYDPSPVPRPLPLPFPLSIPLPLSPKPQTSSHIAHHFATGPEVGTTERLPLGGRYLCQRSGRGALECSAVGKGGGLSVDRGNVYPRGTRRAVRDPGMGPRERLFMGVVHFQVRRAGGKGGERERETWSLVLFGCGFRLQ